MEKINKCKVCGTEIIQINLSDKNFKLDVCFECCTPSTELYNAYTRKGDCLLEKRRKNNSA